jgi:hypothetical protein
MWGLGPTNNVVRREGISEENYVGDSWVEETTQLADISVDASGEVWGVDLQGKLRYRQGEEKWISEKLPAKAKLSKVSVSIDAVWGITTDASVVYREQAPDKHPKDGAEGDWSTVEFEGNAFSISVCPSRSVWVVSWDGVVFFREGIADNTPMGTSWRRIPERLHSIACGATGVWGLTVDEFSVVFRHAVTDTRPTGIRWEEVGPSMSQISTSPTGLVLAVDHRWHAWSRWGITAENPIGIKWVEINGTTVSHVAAGGLTLIPNAAEPETPAEAPLKLSGTWASWGRRYRHATVEKVDGLCMMSGRIGGGSGEIGVVPLECRPSADLYFAINNGDRAVVVNVTTKGDIVFSGFPHVTTPGQRTPHQYGIIERDYEYGWISLDGIIYPPTVRSAFELSPLGVWQGVAAPARTGVVMSTTAGLCALSGTFVFGTMGTIAKLPDECLPPVSRDFHVASSTGVSRLSITPEGDVNLEQFDDAYETTLKWVSLDGVVFSTSETSDLNLEDGYSMADETAAGIERVGSLCFLRGSIQGPMKADSVLAKIPSYCRPNANLIFFSTTQQPQVARVDITTNGRLVFAASGSPEEDGRLFLSGITYDPAAGSKAEEDDTADADPAPPLQESLDLQGAWRNQGKGFRGGVVEITEDGMCLLSGRLREGSQPSAAHLPAHCTVAQRRIFPAAAGEGHVSRLDLLENGTMTLVGDMPEWFSVSQTVYKPNESEGDLEKLGTWTDLGTVNGSAYQGASFYRIANLCILSGVVKAGIPTEAELVMVPQECRPKRRHTFAVMSTVGVLNVTLGPSGRVDLPRKLHTGSWVSLDGIVYDPHAVTELELRGGWTGYGGEVKAQPTVAVEGGLCVIGGLVKGGAWGPVAMLPEDCRPRGRLSFVVTSGATTSQVDIQETGVVQLITEVPPSGWLSLSGIAFDPFVDPDVREINYRMEGSRGTSVPVGDSSVALSGGAFIRVPDTTAFNLEQDLTLELWFRPENSSTAPLAVHRMPKATYGIHFQGLDQPLLFHDSEYHHSNRSRFVPYRWYHAAVVRDTKLKLLTLYINGVKDLEFPIATADPCTTGMHNAEGELPADKCASMGGCTYDSKSKLCQTSSVVPTSDFYIGGVSRENAFVGRLADVRLWDVARPANLVRQTMDKRVASWASGIVSNWQFGSPTGLLHDLMFVAPPASAQGFPEYQSAGPGLQAAADSGGELPPTTCVDTSKGNIRVSHSSHLHFTDSEPFTLEFWFMATRTEDDDGQWIVLKNGDYGVKWQGTHQPLVFFDGNEHVGSTPVKFGNWYHVALVDGGPEAGTLRLYLDGVVDKVDERTPRRFGYSPMRIGGIENTFSGRITDVRVWRLPLSTHQVISGMHRRLTGTEDGLVAYFKFDSERSMAQDSSLRGSYAEVRGAARWLPEGPTLLSPIVGPAVDYEHLAKRGGEVIEDTPKPQEEEEESIEPVDLSSVSEMTGLEFDRAAKVALPRDSTFITQSYSIMFTIKTTEAEGTIMSFWSTPKTDVTFAIANPADLTVYYDLAGDRRVKTGMKVDDGKWHVVAITVDRENRRIVSYLDGMLRSDEPASTDVPMFEGVGSVIFGQRQTCNFECYDDTASFAGALRYVSLWNRILEDTEVRTMTEQPIIAAGVEPELVVFLRMDAGRGTRIIDASGNSRHGTMLPVSVVDRAATLPPTLPIGLIAHFEMDSSGSMDDRVGSGVVDDLMDVGQSCNARAVFKVDDEWETVSKFKNGTGYVLNNADKVVGTTYTVAMHVLLTDVSSANIFRVLGAENGISVKNGLIRTASEQGQGKLKAGEWHKIVIVKGVKQTRVYLDDNLAGAFLLLSESLLVPSEGSMTFFNDGSGTCALNGTGGLLKTIYIWDRALSAKEVTEGLFASPPAAEDVNKPPSGRWVRLLNDAQILGTHVGDAVPVLASGEFTKLRAVYVEGSLYCNASAPKKFGWQRCENRGFAFELKKGSDYVVEQPSWKELPDYCTTPTKPTGDIVCELKGMLTLKDGDTVTPTWYDPSHSKVSNSKKVNLGTVVFDLYGWEMTKTSMPEARAAQFTADASASLGNKIDSNIPALVSVGAECEKPHTFAAEGRYHNVMTFQAGTGFVVDLPIDAVDETRYSIAMLVKVKKASGISPLISTGPNAGLYLQGKKLTLKPGDLEVGDFEIGEWHKVVLTHNLDATAVYIDGTSAYSGSSLDALEYKDKKVYIASTGSCLTNLTNSMSGAIKEVQVFSRPLTGDEVEDLMPRLLLSTESRRAFSLSGYNYMKGSFSAFPRRHVALAFRYRATDSEKADGTFVSIRNKKKTQIELSNPKGVTLKVGDITIPSTTDVSDGKYHHIAFVIDRDMGFARLLVDGQRVGAAGVPTEDTPRVESLVFGQSQGCFGGCFLKGGGLTGRLYGMKIWHSALDDMAIQMDESRTERPTKTQLEKRTTGVDSDVMLTSWWIPEDVRNGVAVDQLGSSRYLNLGIAGWLIDCPNDCSGHGECGAGGHCTCDAGFSGVDCSEGCKNSCSLQGTCVDNTCHCLPQFRGEDCSVAKDPAEDIVSDQCMAVPDGQPRFCSMVQYPVPITLAGDNLEHADDQAFETYKRLSQYCKSPKGREILKYAVCGSFFLECSESGEAYGICRSQCHAYEDLCEMPMSGCDTPLFVSDEAGGCFTHYPEGYPAAFNETCPRNCSGYGMCIDGLCVCDVGYAGADCSEYDGDRTVVPKNLDFCKDLVNYTIPAAYFPDWSDMSAKKSYNLLAPFCEGNIKGLTAMHHTLCATAFFKVEDGKVKKPCKSMCADYGSLCGMPTALTCFSEEFYSSDDDDCFVLDYSDKYKQAAIAVMGQAAWDAQNNRMNGVPAPHCPTNFTCLNGDCIAGQCACLRGWFGKTCDREIPTCPNYCSGHGICQDQRCKCLPGWSGDDCGTTTDLCDFDCTEDGWRAESCCATLENLLHPALKQEEFVSPGCGKNNDCSGHGECAAFQGYQACECFAGWMMWDCSVREVCVKNCSGHGECVHDVEPRARRSGVTVVNKELYNMTERAHTPNYRMPTTAGDSTAEDPHPIPRHPDETSTYSDLTETSRKYTYMTPPQSMIYGPPTWTSARVRCQCASGYFGDDCSMRYRNITLCPNSCSSHGMCVKVPPVLPQGIKIVDMHSNSTRQGPAHRCVCDAGYSGLDCSRMTQCPMNCSGHGQCFGGNCECDPFYEGTDCSTVVAQCGVHFTCLNLGTCDVTGRKCDCPAFYHGKDCSQRKKNPTCPDDFECENGGKCYQGRCLCVPGTFGFDCDGHYSFGVSEWEKGSRLYDIPRNPEEYTDYRNAQPAAHAKAKH